MDHDVAVVLDDQAASGGTPEQLSIRGPIEPEDEILLEKRVLAA